MKKNAIAKGIFSVVFVATAGICYLCAAKIPGQGDGAEILLQKDAQTMPGEEVSGKQQEEEKNPGESETVENTDFSGDTQESAELVYVHVCGAVKEPGVYALPAGSRTADAVLCAGDFLPDAARDYLNLAARIFDGQKIYIPDEAQAERFLEEGVPAGLLESGQDTQYGDSYSAGASEPLRQDGAQVNLNTAGADELMTLPGIGKTKADAILAYRKEHGAFSSCEELMEVPGIKENVYEKICEIITVGK